MICSYCGDPADSLDHFIPHIRNRTHSLKSFKRSEVIPSCRECNTLLGEKLFESIGGRAGYLHTKYQTRYSKIISMPEWGNEELEELGYNLRSMVEQEIKTKKDVLRRVEHCLYISRLSPSSEEVWASHDEWLGV